jgi:hypothetical protein
LKAGYQGWGPDLTVIEDLVGLIGLWTANTTHTNLHGIAGIFGFPGTIVLQLSVPGHLSIYMKES